jgi:Ca2+-binding RTX toxin-like protein
MSARRISAVVCAALTMTFASGSAALAHDNTGSYTDDSCHSPGAIRGTSGNDVLGPPANTTTPVIICGFGGDDIITGSSSADTLIGGPGNDTIRGGGGDDYIEGQGGGDTIFGGNGQDVLLGETGNDKIYANDKDNTNDEVVDTIDGGTGNDLCVFIPDPPSADKATNCP